MMSFINSRLVELSRPLKAAYFPFSRAQDLSRALSWCVTDYATKASIGQLFEARGVLVIGESRQGKSREIQRFRDKFNGGSEIMPDGRPARIVHCILSGKVTWKDLGVKVLSALGYPLKGRNTQAEIWVVKYAELQGVVGIHFDECQHVFSEVGERTNQQILDSFKTLLKDSRWPLMLILSGIPSLAAHVAKEEQLVRLLRTVHFATIDLTRQKDVDEMLNLTFVYAEKAGLDFGPLGGTLAGSSFPAKVVSALLGLLRFFDNMTDGAVADSMKVVLIEMLGNPILLEQGMAQFGPGFDEVIIDDRNQVAIDDLKAIIEHEPEVRSVAIFYGAAHMPDMAQRLKEQLGYEAAEEQWLTAIKLDFKKSAVTQREIDQLRAMVKRMLHQQLRPRRR